MTNHPRRPARQQPAGWALYPVSPEELRELIEHAGITQSDAAQRCHASPRTMRQWLAGDRAMPLSASEALALSLMWPGVGRVIEPSLMLVERWIRPQFAGLILCAKPPAEKAPPFTTCSGISAARGPVGQSVERTTS